MGYSAVLLGPLYGAITVPLSRVVVVVVDIERLAYAVTLVMMTAINAYL